jgi:hypothetical protein
LRPLARRSCQTLGVTKARMEPVVPRPTTEAEVAVIAEALEVAPVAGVESPSRSVLAALSVVCRCECGCASIGFVPNEAEPIMGATRLADAEGTTADGRYIGILVWGTTSTVTSLELYGGPDNEAVLPAPGTLRPF